MKRIHVQLSCSFRPDDAERLIPLIKEAIANRPPNCGAFFRTQSITSATAEAEASVVTILELAEKGQSA